MLHIALIISIVHDIFFLILHEQYCLRRESIIAYLIVGVYGVCCAGRPTTTAIAITAGGTTKLLRKMEIQALDNSQADASSGGGKLILSCIPYFFYVFFFFTPLTLYALPSHWTNHQHVALFISFFRTVFLLVSLMFLD